MLENVVVVGGYRTYIAEERQKEIPFCLRKTLANYELPYRYKIVENLPHTESGKKDRKSLDKVR